MEERLAIARTLWTWGTPQAKKTAMMVLLGDRQVYVEDIMEAFNITKNSVVKYLNSYARERLIISEKNILISVDYKGKELGNKFMYKYKHTKDVSY